MVETQSKIEIFLESMPWIKNFRDNIFVLKYGGEILLSEQNIQNIATDIELLTLLGIRTVVVHGGGPQLDKVLNEKEISFEKKNGMRVYSKDILQESQKVFKLISRDLKRSIDATGIKTKLIPKDYVKVERIPGLGYVGKVTDINPLFSKMIDGIIVPIMPLFGRDGNGELCNLNADDMAVSVAEALGAEKLIIHTSVDGVFNKRSEIITHLNLEKAEGMIQKGYIKGGMIPKVLHCLQSEKVGKIHIINGNIPHALLYEVFTEKGIGTEIVRN